MLALAESDLVAFIAVIVWSSVALAPIREHRARAAIVAAKPLLHAGAGDLPDDFLYTAASLLIKAVPASAPRLLGSSASFLPGRFCFLRHWGVQAARPGHWGFEALRRGAFGVQRWCARVVEAVAPTLGAMVEHSGEHVLYLGGKSSGVLIEQYSEPRLINYHYASQRLWN